MSIRERLSGNEASAVAMKQINPDVVAAFPITPSTEIPQYFSTFVSNGQVDTEFVAVESEHSAMSACIGAEAAGARAMTATSANGLSFMWEMLYIASGSRLPIVMSLVNRAVSGPLNIHNDHSDAMGVRDAGWIMLFSENNQEAYDNLIMAHQIAENKDVLLPLMVCQDGFITSHAVENITLLEDEAVKDFVGEYHPEEFLLNPGKPIAVGPYSISNYAMEAKKNQEVALENSKEVIKEVAKKYKELTGRGFELFEEYKTEDADYIMLIMGSAAGTAKEAVDELRAEGKKVGVLKLRVFRPFPSEEIAKALANCKAVAVMDRCESYNGNGGPLGSEVPAALFKNKIMIEAVNYIYGLAGRDFTIKDVKDVFAELEDMIENGKTVEQYQYIRLRG